MALTFQQFIRPTLTATAAGLLLLTLGALGAFARPASAADGGPAAAGAASSQIHADSAVPTQRQPVRRLRHSLRMPFFSFQPLG